MRKKHFAIVIFILVFPLSYAFSGGVTNLSKKASNLKIGMSREAVIRLLGPATWAIIPSDKGEWALPERLGDLAFGLELYWRNPSCAPVIVQFDQNLKAVGWDEGRAYCGKDAHLFRPPDELSCKKPDRAKFCE